jgi:hypothetical protein
VRAQFVIQDGEPLAKFARFISVPRAALEKFLSSQAPQVAVVETEAYGAMRIYRID